ncbi:MAG TPA: hypothetical protein VG738_03315 [Chitinophagaceae bacterium]|nr:hypothetical protein [Chitinophagaceae bacterium]
MDYNYEQTPLSRSVFAGLAVGLIACLINLAYNYAFRDITDYSLSTIVNVSSLIFASVLLPVVAGVIYYFLTMWTKAAANYIFIIAFGLLTAIVIFNALGIQRSSNPVEAAQFRWLYIGIMLVIGGLTTFMIPFFYRKDYF